MSEKKILLFAEDPGAALFMRGLPAALRAGGVRPVTMALPYAAPYFPDENLLAIPTVLDDAAAELLLQREAPVALVFGTSENIDSFAFALRRAALRQGVPTLSPVDSAANAEYRFRGSTEDPLYHAPDSLLVPDAATAMAFQALGMPDTDLAICGHPRFDEIAAIRGSWTAADRADQRRRHFPAAGAGDRIVVFVSELSTGLGGDQFRRDASYSLDGTSKSSERSHIAGEELILALSDLPFPVHHVLRLHPKNRIAEEAGFAARFDQVSQGEPGLEIVNAADLVVGMTSILLVEAACLGRPALSIVPRAAERAWLGAAADIIPCAFRRSDVAAFIARGATPEGWPPTAFAGEVADANARMVTRILADCDARGI